MGSDGNWLDALALCWRLERKDGAGIAVTSHDSAVVASGVIYSPEPGMTPASVARSLGLEPHASEMSGALSAAAIREEDLELGLWADARVTLLAIDWEQPDEEPMTLLAGQLGEVRASGNAFAAELRGAAARLNAPVCPSTSAECRAELGDQHCRVNLAGSEVRATVVSSDGTALRLDRAFDARHLFGRLRYLSGPNCGASTTVLAGEGDEVRVRDLARADVAPGTRVALRIGCDKRLETCRTRFQNVENFRGEPHLPGNDLLTRYPGA